MGVISATNCDTGLFQCGVAGCALMSDYRLCGVKGWVVVFALGQVVMDLLGFEVACRTQHEVFGWLGCLCDSSQGLCHGFFSVM